jgi:hypothetical protein
MSDKVMKISNFAGTYRSTISLAVSVPYFTRKNFRYKLVLKAYPRLWMFFEADFCKKERLKN